MCRILYCRMKDVDGFDLYCYQSCRLDSKNDEEWANEAYSLYMSENPQSQSKKTAADFALCGSKGSYLSFVGPNPLSNFEMEEDVQ